MASRLLRRSVWYWERAAPTLHLPLSADATTVAEEAGEEDEEEEDEDEEEEEEGGGGGRRMLSRRAGLVVALGWMFSRRKNLAPYSRLYRSLGWDCLLCHPHVANLFFSHPATTLAVCILDELAKDLESHPCPVVFAVFSGGHKACFYKIIQILQGKCKDVGIEADRYEVVVRCLVGVIFDSSPVDYLGEHGARFVSHQMLTLEPGKPFTLISRVASAVGKGVDFIFSKQMEVRREELWHALYSSVRIGPILFFCCENDELSPLETIEIFASNLRKLGGRVDITVWKQSEHVGHYRLFPELYSSKVKKLLTEASILYMERLQKSAQLEGDGHGHGHEVDLPLELSTGTSWTTLPKSIASEIERISKLPHVKSKRSNRAKEKKKSAEEESISSLAASTCSGPMIRSRL